MYRANTVYRMMRSPNKVGFPTSLMQKCQPHEHPSILHRVDNFGDVKILAMIIVVFFTRAAAMGFMALAEFSRPDEIINRHRLQYLGAWAQREAEVQRSD